jgi:hypothetical protein
MNTPEAVFFWRKLDAPGHDSCQFFRRVRGFRLQGVAVFVEGKRICQLRYDVHADAAFRTTHARVTGFVGKAPVDLRIRSRRGAQWELDGKRQPRVRGCIDVDLGFTPATNLLAVRRLALRVGEAADAPAAYLAFPEMDLRVLPQHYRRVSRAEYDYRAPTFGYRGTLRISRIGAVVDYPGLFELVRGG